MLIPPMTTPATPTAIANKRKFFFLAMFFIAFLILSVLVILNLVQIMFQESPLLVLQFQLLGGGKN